MLSSNCYLQLPRPFDLNESMHLLRAHGFQSQSLVREVGRQKILVAW